MADSQRLQVRRALHVLKTPLYLDEAALQTPLRGQVAEVEFSIAWPEVRWDVIPGFVAFVPYCALPHLGLDVLRVAGEPPHLTAGRIGEPVRFNGVREPAQSVEVRAVEVRVLSEGETSTVHYRLERALDSWFTVFGAWLAARTGQVGSAIVLQRIASKSGERVRLFDVSEVAVTELPSHLGIDGNWQHPSLDLYPSAGSEEVADAAARANRGETLSAAHDLLVSAREALVRGLHIRSVVDAYAAVEVAVFNWLDRYYRERRETALDSVAHGTYDLAKQIGPARKKHLPLPEDFEGSLKIPRGRAVHGATAPCFEEALVALQWASEAIAAADPLPNLLDGSPTSALEPQA